MAKWQEMPDWSELQHDLLVLIVRRLNLIEDYLNFGTVCKSWRSVATKNNFNSDLPRVPWLMLAEEVDDSVDSDHHCRKFVSLYSGMILKKRIPKARGKRCMESMGWLITVVEDEGEISLLHPFSGVRIELPHRTLLNSWAVVRKAVLSANPSHTSDYSLMIIGGKFRLLGFWRSGDLSWTSVADRYTTLCFRDAVYYNGHFYAVDNRGTVLVCDVASPETTERHILACVEGSKEHTREMQWPPPHDRQFYIVESLGSLFVVMQYGVASRNAKGDGDRIPLTSIFEDSDGDDDEDTYGTTNFLVFQADLAAGRLRQTRELGDRAFFLGANSSLSVQASQFPGIKPNHIYFTDNCWDTYKYKEGGGLDMGVFNLADGSIQPHYEGVSLSRVCPPTWVTPTLC